MKITIAAIFVTTAVFFTSIELSSQSSAGSSRGDRGGGGRKDKAKLPLGPREGGNRIKLTVPLDIDWVNIDLNLPGLTYFPAGGVEIRLQQNTICIGSIVQGVPEDVIWEEKRFGILQLKEDADGIIRWHGSSSPGRWLKLLHDWAMATSSWDEYHRGVKWAKELEASKRQSRKRDKGQAVQQAVSPPHEQQTYQQMPMLPYFPQSDTQMPIGRHEHHSNQQQNMGAYWQPRQQLPAVRTSRQSYNEPSAMETYTRPAQKQFTLSPDFLQWDSPASYPQPGLSTNLELDLHNHARYVNYHTPFPDQDPRLLNVDRREFIESKIEPNANVWEGTASEPQYNAAEIAGSQSSRVPRKGSFSLFRRNPK